MPRLKSKIKVKRRNNCPLLLFLKWFPRTTIFIFKRNTSGDKKFIYSFLKKVSLLKISQWRNNLNSVALSVSKMMLSLLFSFTLLWRSREGMLRAALFPMESLRVWLIGNVPFENRNNTSFFLVPFIFRKKKIITKINEEKVKTSKSLWGSLVGEKKKCATVLAIACCNAYKCNAVVSVCSAKACWKINKGNIHSRWIVPFRFQCFQSLFGSGKASGAVDSQERPNSFVWFSLCVN